MNLTAQSVSLRPVQSDDEPFCRGVFASSRLGGLGLRGGELLEPVVDQQYRLQDLAYRAQYPGSQWQIIECDGRPVGRMLVARMADELHLVDIALLPPARGHGVGTAVITGLLREAGPAGWPVRLQVAEGNPARRLYLRLGFTPIGLTGMDETMEWRPERGA